MKHVLIGINRNVKGEILSEEQQAIKNLLKNEIDVYLF